MKKIIFEKKYFKNNSEWDYFLFQLGIPEKKRIDVDEVLLNVDKPNIELRDTDGNEIKP